LVSTGGRVSASLLRLFAIGVVVLVGAGALGSTALFAQSLSALGVRAGAGVDREGKLVYDGRIGLADLSGSTAVEVALRGFGEASSTKTYESARISRRWENREEMRVWSVGLMADILLRHGRETRGPYFMLGLGLGPVWYDWRRESEDPSVGDPVPEGGSVLTQDGVILGSMLSAGLGQRLHRRVDLRVQGTVAFVPSTDLREELTFVPFLTLTTGVRP